MNNGPLQMSFFSPQSWAEHNRLTQARPLTYTQQMIFQNPQAGRQDEQVEQKSDL